MSRKLLAVLALLLILALGAAAPAAADAPRVKLTTNMGAIVLELDPARAPKTVENFLAYVRAGFYEGTLFHRVIAGSIIQGGGLTADLARKRTRAPIPNEAGNGLKNLAGTVAMARLTEPHTATSQFFINLGDNIMLDNRGTRRDEDWGYAVFGRVVEGMEVVTRISELPTYTVGPYDDVPQRDVVITRAEIL